MNRFFRELEQTIRRSPQSPPRVRRLLRVAHSLGIHIAPYRGLGVDLDSDVAELLRAVAAPVIFDVGANTGQTIHRMRSMVPTCRIHAFEPSPASFRSLSVNTRGLDGITLVEAGVGAVDGEQTLLENEYSDMSSFLVPGHDAWGRVVRESRVRVVRLDTYCEQEAVDVIDLLKVDTQGYDLEVIRGAERLLAGQRVHAVQLEVIFSDMYEGRSQLDETYRFMIDHGFRLLAFYNLFVTDGAASWCDALFVRAPDRS